MTLGELYQEVGDLLEALDEETEVRIAIQPSWPLQSTVRGLVASPDLPPDREPADADDPDDDVPKIVWIVEGSQIASDGPLGGPYAPRAVFGW